MNAYKCDICKCFFEDKRLDIHTTNTPKMAYGHHNLELLIERVDSVPNLRIFKGDICPDCYGLFCEEMVERGCSDKYVSLDAEAHRKDAEKALEHFEKNVNQPTGYYDDLIEYLSQFDESDVVKVKYIRQKIEAAIGESVDWYERRKCHE